MDAIFVWRSVIEKSRMRKSTNSWIFFMDYVNAFVMDIVNHSALRKTLRQFSVQQHGIWSMANSTAMLTKTLVIEVDLENDHVHHYR